jgi:hypothetical protein
LMYSATTSALNFPLYFFRAFIGVSASSWIRNLS